MRWSTETLSPLCTAYRTARRVRATVWRLPALAGVPKEVIKRARQKLRELESISPNAAATQVDGTQMSLLFCAGRNLASGQALENLDPDSLTPRQALEWIYRLKSLV